MSQFLSLSLYRYVLVPWTVEIVELPKGGLGASKLPMPNMSTCTINNLYLAGKINGVTCLTEGVSRENSDFELGKWDFCDICSTLDR